MGRIIAAVYDRMMAGAEDACLGQWRAELLGGLSGRVIEVGAGTGLNLPYYPTALQHLVLTEPDAHMRRQLARKVASLPARSPARSVEVLDGSLDDLAQPAGAFDAVVATLVLCSVAQLDRALQEIRRVLKPGGQFVFLEHVAADHRPNRLKWQRRVEPVWKRLAAGCHLTRRTGEAIREAGFTMAELKRESMRKAWPLVRTTIRGIAVKS